MLISAGVTPPSLADSPRVQGLPDQQLDSQRCAQVVRPPARPGSELTRQLGPKVAALSLSITFTQFLSRYDKSNSAWARRTQPFGSLSVIGREGGNLLVGSGALSLGGLALFGPRRYRARRLNELGSLVVSQSISIGLADLLKVTVRRPRPDSGAPSSFPSGHTTSAFAASTFVWHRYGWKVGLPTTLFSAFVGFSRIQDGRHYLSDVLAGAILGTAIGYVVDVLYTEAMR